MAVVAVSFSLWQAGVAFLFVTSGGILVGLARGRAFAWLRTRLNNPAIETTTSILTPYAAFLAADKLGVSGVLCVLIVGLYLGQQPRLTSSVARLQPTAAWGTLLFVWVFANICYSCAMARRRDFPWGKIVWGEIVVTAWTGMRGFDSLITALALPLFIKSGEPFPERDRILFVTACVILTTLLLQGCVGSGRLDAHPGRNGSRFQPRRGGGGGATAIAL